MQSPGQPRNSPGVIREGCSRGSARSVSWQTGRAHLLIYRHVLNEDTSHRMTGEREKWTSWWIMREGESRARARSGCRCGSCTSRQRHDEIEERSVRIGTGFRKEMLGRCLRTVFGRACRVELVRCVPRCFPPSTSPSLPSHTAPTLQGTRPAQRSRARKSHDTLARLRRGVGEWR